MRMQQREHERAPEALSEAERIYNWRRACLCEAGFDRVAAAVLAADARVDLHAALELVRRGCPPETALRILE